MIRAITLFALAAASLLQAQELSLREYLQRLKSAPGLTVEQKIGYLDSIGVSLSARGIRELEGLSSRPDTTPAIPRYSSTPNPLFDSPELRSGDGEDRPLGTLNSNRYDPDSVSNPYGRYGSRYSPDSVNNPYGRYGSRYSPYSATNPYATDAPKIVAPDGSYKGRYSANPYEPESTSNPHGRYGSPYSSDSINNPYGAYGTSRSTDRSTWRNQRPSYGVSRPRSPRPPALPALPRLPR